MRAARVVTAMVLTAHGSADPRSAASAHRVAGAIGLLRPDLDVRVAFCEHSSPLLAEVLGERIGCDRRSGADAVVVPMLLAAAYHWGVDVPAVIAASGARVHLADALGEDERLIHALRQRLEQAGVSRLDPRVGVLVTAVGSSDAAANARTATVAAELPLTTRWRAATAYATGPAVNLDEAADGLLRAGATRLVIAPWFLAPGRLLDRVAAFARGRGLEMSAPLGAHRRVAETLLDRFDAALPASLAA